MLLALLGLGHALAGDVLLNEVLYDPSGSDTGAEWIELCNASSASVDLTGWTVQAAGASWSTIYTFPALSIAPGEHLLIGAGSAYALSGTMQNGGSDTDGLRLVMDDGGTSDTLLYDSPNTNGLVDDSGAAGTDFAPDVSEGHVLARIPDCEDSDDSSLDWADLSSATPGAENVDDGGGDSGGGDGGAGDGGGTSTADCSRLTVKINELMPDPDSEGGDGGYEWVELFNTSGAAVDLSGWTLVNRKSESSSKTITLPEGTTLPPGGFLVLGEELVAEADVVVDLDLGNDGSSIDTVELYCGEAYVDLAAYGGKNDLGWLDEGGEVATVAAIPATGWSLGRAIDGADTDDCAVDLVSFEYATPGESNATSGEGDCPGMDDVKINEFIPNPAKQEKAEEEDPEWIELYNAGSAAVSLDGWGLRYGTSPSSTKTIDIGALGSIEPGQHLVVGEKGAAGVDLVVEIDMGAASSNSDRLELRHCGPGTADTVVYGSPNDDAWTDDSGMVASSLAPDPGDGDTLQRVRDGYDTDESGVDWAISESPSPGESNPEIEPVVCTPGDRSVKVNEIFPDPDGTDTDQEWVELFNAGGAAVRLDGWVIETATSSWGADFTFPGGVELQPGDFLLVGGSAVPTADLVASSLGLGNAGTAPDGVRLVDCEGSTQDTVLYGEAAATAEDLELLDDAGGQSMAPMSESGLSVGRVPDGADTDDNAVDFSGALSPTPGAANGTGDGGDGGADDDEDDGGKGCAKKGGAEGKKCGVVGVAGGLEWGLLALVALRRRRR
ncbi:lamin tail domain-containing protein [Myxococcota bacterium]|nr:lamin tail domain-containing protein [Myxococcota bacterium]